jgi:hypothetical protein
MTGHNKFREEFYKAVVEKAKQLEAKRVGDTLLRRYSGLKRFARDNLRSIKHHMSGKYLAVHRTPHLHGVRTSPPILPFSVSIYSFGRPRTVL